MNLNSILIVSDLEGCYAVEKFSETRCSGKALENSRKLHTLQLNILIQSIRSFNKKIALHVWDSHGCGGINKKEIDDVDNFIHHGKFNFINYLKENHIDAVFFDSAHAKNRTPCANLCHTMSSIRIKRYVLNGNEIGEIGLRSVMAGELDIPVFYVNGDDKACTEAKSIMPWIVTTVTKHSRGIQKIARIPCSEVFKLIREDVYIALKSAEKMRPRKYHKLILILNGN